MTITQFEMREERVAICIIDAGLTEQEAEALCNNYPELYGYREVAA